MSSFFDYSLFRGYFKMMQQYTRHWIEQLIYVPNQALQTVNNITNIFSIKDYTEFKEALKESLTDDIIEQSHMLYESMNKEATNREIEGYAFKVSPPYTERMVEESMRLFPHTVNFDLDFVANGDMENLSFSHLFAIYTNAVTNTHEVNSVSKDITGIVKVILYYFSSEGYLNSYTLEFR